MVFEVLPYFDMYITFTMPVGESWAGKRVIRSREKGARMILRTWFSSPWLLRSQLIFVQ